MTSVPNPFVIDADTLTGELKPIRRVALGLGSNLGDRLEYLQAAVDTLTETPDIVPVVKRGTYYLTINLGSGFRAHPLDTATADEFFSIRDFREEMRLAGQVSGGPPPFETVRDGVESEWRAHRAEAQRAAIVSEPGHGKDATGGQAIVEDREQVLRRRVAQVVEETRAGHQMLVPAHGQERRGVRITGVALDENVVAARHGLEDRGRVV